MIQGKRVSIVYITLGGCYAVHGSSVNTMFPQHGVEATSILTDLNKALARRTIVEMWKSKHLDVIDVVHAPSPDNHQGAKRFVSAYLAAFPDLHNTILHHIAEADQVATRYTTKAPTSGHWRIFLPPASSSPLRGPKHTALPKASSSRCGTAAIR